VNPRSTLILLVLVALAGGALWHFELRDGANADVDDARTDVFAGLEATQIEWVELAQPDGAVVRLEKRGEAWRIAKPIDFAADRVAADAVASGLAELATETVFDPAAEDALQRPEAPESYGLTREPRVRFSAAGKTHALRLGDPTPVAGNVYVAADGDARVFVVPQWQTDALAKSLAELRETKLLDFDREKLTRIALAWVGGSVTLEKQDGAWRLAAPLEDAADEVAVQALLTELQSLRAEAFLDAPPSDERLGLAAPAYRAELALEGGATVALSLGAKRESEKLAARAGASGVVEVAASILERLPRDVIALRDKTLASFVSSEAQRFTLTFAEPGGETLSVAGESTPEGWKTQPAMAAGAASALVAEVASLSAGQIAAESLGEAELAAFGLAPPRARLLVLGAGEGEAAKTLADLRLGVLRPGSGLAAQRADRPVVYWIDESRAAGLPQSAAQFRASFAEKPEAAPAPARE
jgi:hypothetical protein